MTIGYSSFGQCFATSNEAIDNFYASQNGFVIQLGTAPYIAVPVKQTGIWKYSLQNAQTGVISFTSTAAQTTVYGNCTLEQSNYWNGTYDYTAAAAAWSFAFVTVMGTWLIAKNIGTILSAIKRW